MEYDVNNNETDVKFQHQFML